MESLIIVAVVVVVFLVIVAVVLVGARRFQPGEEDPLAARLAEISERGEVVSLEEIELSQPFSQRVLIPIIRRLGDISSRFTPQHVLESTTRRLELAGSPGRVDASMFLASRFVSAVILGGLLAVIFAFTDRWSVGVEVLVNIGFIVLGFFFPQIWLKSRP